MNSRKSLEDEHKATLNGRFGDVVKFIIFNFTPLIGTIWRVGHS